MTFRVIDRQARITAPTTEREIVIAGKACERRLIEAPALLTVVQECRTSIARDSWETEGDLNDVTSTWVGVFVWKGDKKCSCATYWNTGNPRSLAESHAWVLANEAQLVPEALYEFLSHRHRRSIYRDRGQPLSSWFEGPADAIASDIEEFLVKPITSGQRPDRYRHDPSEPVVYLMREHGTNWIKIGKCSGTRSPPAKRRSMYQPGNPREIMPVAAWTFEGTNPERRLQAALRDEAQRRGFARRSEWFEICADDAMNILEPKLAACWAVSTDRLGR